MIEQTLFMKWVAKWSALGLLILLGALANASVQYKKAKEQQMPFGIIDFILAICIAAFSGTLFGSFAVSFLGVDDGRLYPIAGAGAFLGVAGINKALETIIKKYG